MGLPPSTQITSVSLLGLEVITFIEVLYLNSSPISNFWHFEIDRRQPLKLIKKVTH